MSERQEIFVSLAVVFDRALPEALEQTLAEAEALLRDRYANYELLLIDNTGTAALEQRLLPLLTQIPKLRFLRLSGTVQPEVALASGQENAIGDLIVLTTPDNYTPEALISGVALCCDGNDVVIGCSERSKPLWYRLGSTFFRTFFGKMIGYDLPPDDTGFRVISRRAANAVMTTARFHYHLFVRLSGAGFGEKRFHYPLAAQSRRQVTATGAFARAVSMLVFNSVKPLRLVNFLGLLASFMAMLIGLYSLLVHLFKSQVVEGWTTLTLFMSVLFFCLFLILAILGEYLVRLLLDRADDAAYHVMFEKHSSVMLDAARLNVLTESERTAVNRVQTGRDR